MNRPNPTKCALGLRSTLSEKILDPIAKSTGFCLKRRKLTASRAAWTFVVGMASGTANTLADFVRIFGDLTGERMAYKPFYDRLKTEAFPEFLRQVLEVVMGRLLEPVLRPRDRRLKRFSDIWLHDGSSFALHEGLQKFFRGRFTKISPAAAEIHGTYSLFEGQPVRISVAPDSEGERGYLPEPEEVRRKLLLIDAGYVSLRYFEAVREHGGDVICKARKNINPLILKCYRGDRTSVGKKLKDLKLLPQNYDFLVESRDESQRRHVFRLVVYYCRKKKKYVYYYTTLDAREFSPNKVAWLYRLRWQIELFFKECKSYTQLKAFRTQNPHIAEGLMWATMVALVIRRYLLFSAFRRSKRQAATFIAAAMSWTFFRDLGRCAARGYRGLVNTLAEILRFLRENAERTNPQRTDTFDVLEIGPVGGYA